MVNAPEILSVNLPDLVEQVATALIARRMLLVTAESCTGGSIAAALTERPGSSAWFERGFVTYSYASKTALLSVSAATLATQGAVSEATAHEMAVGALHNSQAAVSLSVTGIAGPDGGTPQKPVGTVCFGWALADGTYRVETRQFAGNRHAVREQASIHALSGLLDWLHQKDASAPGTAMQ